MTHTEYTHHACVIVLRGLCLVLLHHTGEAARVGGGAGEVMTLRDGRGPATEIRTTPWVNHSPEQPNLYLMYKTVIQHAAAAQDNPAVYTGMATQNTN